MRQLTLASIASIVSIASGNTLVTLLAQLSLMTSVTNCLLRATTDHLRLGTKPSIISGRWIVRITFPLTAGKK